jgi:pyruvate carboxylase
MFAKVLVANRGEIAVRAFRAAYELRAGTVAVFPYEDRNSVHRLKADESYEIGEPGHPVRTYLDVAAIVQAAQRAGADAVYPGYGFLSGNPSNALVGTQGTGPRRGANLPSTLLDSAACTPDDVSTSTSCQYTHTPTAWRRSR